jgi:hypothetical protein
MIGTIGGSTSPFDAPFCFAELALILAWLFAIATVRLQRRVRGRRIVALGLAITGELLLPIAWNVLAPSRDWTDVTRLFVGTVLTVTLWVVSWLWAVRSAADDVWPRWPGKRAFAAVGLVGLALWTFWTVSLLSN